jgi:hypothetical protein
MKGKSEEKVLVTLLLLGIGNKVEKRTQTGVLVYSPYIHMYIRECPDLISGCWERILPSDSKTLPLLLP